MCGILKDMNGYKLGCSSGMGGYEGGYGLMDKLKIYYINLNIRGTIVEKFGNAGYKGGC